MNITDPHYSVLYDFGEFGCREINADIIANGRLEIDINLSYIGFINLIYQLHFIY